MKSNLYDFNEIKTTSDLKEEEEDDDNDEEWSIDSKVDPSGRWCALSTVSISIILAMSTWFSTNVILPQLQIVFDIHNQALLSLLVVSPNIGFVIMATLLSILSLADMMTAKYWIILGSFFGAFFNSMIIFVGNDNINISLCIFFRILTGASMAMIYPSSVKLISSWFKYKRGLAVGVVIGALTVGTSTPNLLNGFNDVLQLNWQYVIISTSSLSFLAAFIPIPFLKNGPYSADKSPFDSKQIIKCFQNKELRYC